MINNLIIQNNPDRWIFFRLLRPLMKLDLRFMKNVLTLLVKSVFNLSGLTASASAADAGIHKKY